MSAERARALVEAREFLHKHYPPCLGYPQCDGDLPGEPHEDNCPAKDRKPKKPAELLADYAALAVEREREECAKATCEQCRNNAWSDPVPDAGHKGRYIHVKLFNGQKAYCSASAIWARDAERG